MEALMTPPMIWVVAAAIFCVGMLVGVAIPRRSSPDKGRTQELESQLQASRKELATYRDQVTQHFVQTADLLHAMTANYRAVYEHLANGAQNLCDGQARILNAAALRERLLPTESLDQMPVGENLGKGEKPEEILPEESSSQISAEPRNSLDPVSDETIVEQKLSPDEYFLTHKSSNSQREEQRDQK